MGSPYGGWVFFHWEGLYGGKALLAGVGEDISFDVGLSGAYGMQCTLVDPTPRAIAHFRSAIRRVPGESKEGYSLSGLQSVKAYDLRGFGEVKPLFIEAAISTESGSSRFFPPANPDHVSYSLTKTFGSKRTQTGRVLSVPTITPQDVAELDGVSCYDLVKLDVEGAEHDIIDDILEIVGSHSQLLIEMDGLRKRTLSEYKKAKTLTSKLMKRGFRMLWRDKFNFLFVGESLPGGA